MTLGFCSALLGADVAHRFWNPDLRIPDFDPEKEDIIPLPPREKNK
eukprot:gene9203-1289_t